MKTLIAAAAAVALSVGLTGAASAATFTIANTSAAVDSSTVPYESFNTGLQNAGYNKFVSGSAGAVDVSGTATIRVELKSSEAIHSDTFYIGTSPIVTNNTYAPTSTFTDSQGLTAKIFAPGDQTAANDFFNNPGVFLAQLSVSPTDLLAGNGSALSFLDANSSTTAVNGNNDSGWGVFYNGNDVNNLTSVVLGFNDGSAVDGNHDDLQIKLTIVPEPATWMLMILGFAGLGFAARRRRLAHA